MEKARIGVWGASGLAGGELLRLLAGHPGAEVAFAVSRSRAGRPIGETHPHLRPAYGDRRFDVPEAAEGREADLVLLAVPHGAAVPLARAALDRGIRVADLSSDFRLRDPEDYPRWYGRLHPAPDLLAEAVYGLPELHREAIRSARLVSGVGCNAAAAILGLAPLVRAGRIAQARIELRVGSSEAGAEPSPGSHHPFRSRALRVVEPFRHRHAAELIQETGLAEERFTFTQTTAEMVRGIQMLAQVDLDRPAREAELRRLYREAYEGEPFVSLCPAAPARLRIPDPQLTLGTNRALTGFALHEDGRRLLLGCALDNLGKGAAGTALQCVNLMLGLEESSGLEALAPYPA